MGGVGFPHRGERRGGGGEDGKGRGRNRRRPLAKVERVSAGLQNILYCPKSPT